jgi:hypothetical protein
LHKNCLLKHIVEGKVEGGIEVTGRQRRSQKKPLDDFNDMQGYWKLIEEVLDHIVWSTVFGRTYGPVTRQTME